MSRWMALLLVPALLLLTVACGDEDQDERMPAASVEVTAAETPLPSPATNTPAPPPLPTDTPPPAPPPTNTPEPPPPPPPPANQPPAFAQPATLHEETYFIRDNQGHLTSSVTTFTIPGASDPDGDPLTYTWTASEGSISGSGLTATWTRVAEGGQVQPGTVTVTVSDGRGGSDTLTIHRPGQR